MDINRGAEQKTVVHVAGPVENGNFQGCANCRTPLIDYRNAMVMVADGGRVRGLGFWLEGALIGVLGNGSFVLPDGRPLAPGQELCDEDAFGVALERAFDEAIATEN